MIAQLDSDYIKTRPTKVLTRLISYALFEGRPVTTRGRWINPLVFAHYALEKRLPPLKTIRQPLFIVGTGRSGTTVLGVTLSMHREVGFLNEPKALWHVIHPEEDLVGSYSRNAARYRLTAEDATSDVRRTAHRLFGAYLAATMSRRVVDKYPELIFRVPFVKALFPDAKFLFLVRNGWDTCNSIEAWSGRLGQQVGSETHDWWGTDRRKWHLLVEQIVSEHPDLAPYAEVMHAWVKQTDMAAVEWVVTMREGLALLQQYSDDVMRVTYEELCAEPRRVLQEIAAFAGLATGDEVFLRYGEAMLKPVAPKQPFPLAPAIEQPFRKVMQSFGYKGESGCDGLS